MTIFRLLLATLVLSACSIDPSENPAGNSAEPSPSENPSTVASVPVAQIELEGKSPELPPALQLAESDDVEGMRELILKTPRKVWQLGPDGETALHHAKSRPMVELLWEVPVPRGYEYLDSATSLYQMKDYNGRTPLHKFVIERRLEAIDVVMEKTCGWRGLWRWMTSPANPIYVRDHYDNSPLDIANQRADKQILNILATCE